MSIVILAQSSASDWLPFAISVYLFSKKNKNKNNLQTSPELLPPLRNTCCFYAAFLLKSSLFILTFKGINRYAVAKTKSTPMFDFKSHSPDQARARCNQECLIEFNQSKSPQLLLKASSCLNVL